MMPRAGDLFHAFGGFVVAGMRRSVQIGAVLRGFGRVRPVVANVVGKELRLT